MAIQVMGENSNNISFLSDKILSNIIIKLIYKVCFVNKVIDIFYYIAENIYNKVNQFTYDMYVLFASFRLLLFALLYKEKLKRFRN